MNASEKPPMNVANLRRHQAAVGCLTPIFLVARPTLLQSNDLPPEFHMNHRRSSQRVRIKLVLAALALLSASDRACADEPQSFPRPVTGFDSLLIAQQGSRGSLFDDTKKSAPATEPLGALFADDASKSSPWRGFVRGELAYTLGDPEHWSKLMVRSELDAQGSLTPDVRYKLGARFDYDFVYDATQFYPSDVQHDQRTNFMLRENYLDFGVGDLDVRFGRQHIVWGEMVGLFFADVVSAKDLREFILPDFDILRIPQWAARAEYTKDDFHAETIWVFAPSYDEIGKPGADFFPAAPPPPPGFATFYDNEQIPKRDLSHTNYGLRLSWLRNGWDLSGFYYNSMDSSATFYRQIVVEPRPAFVYQARHDRIGQFGATLAKDFGQGVFKAEAVYTHGRRYNVLRLDQDDGVVRQNTLDLVAGLDFPLPADSRLNLQLFTRAFFNHDPDIVPKRNEPGFSVLFNRKITDRLEAEVLWITSLVRTDWMLRPKLAWDFQRNWRLVLGIDLFEGPTLGFFGQFDNRDRVYTEVRYSF
jgi:hypothetical protein